MIDETKMTLAVDWDFRDLTGWQWSEKLDGCRAYWDGTRFWTRHGNIIPSPQWFTQRLPAAQLDGEIWAGRGQFEVARLAVQFGRFTRSIRFAVFDMPDARGDWLQRMAAARLAIGENRFVFGVETGTVKHAAEPSAIAANIIADGGEGAIFRNPGVKEYQRKRTVNLARVKAANLRPRWYGMKPRRETIPAAPVIGLDVSQFPFDPEIEWNIAAILGECDYSELSKPIN